MTRIVDHRSARRVAAAVAAIDAVRRWQSEPTLLDGGPVDVVMAVSVSVSLEQASAVPRGAARQHV